MVRQIQPDERYRDRLIKLIPAEIAAAYLVVQANLIELSSIVVIWIVIFVLFALTFLFTLFWWSSENCSAHIFRLCVSHLGFFNSTGAGSRNIYNPPLASIVLVLWTLLIPFFFTRSPLNR